MHSSVCTCRKGHVSSLRKWACASLGKTRAESMSDDELREYASSQGYITFCVYNGSYVFPVDILMTKMEYVNELVENGKAAWLNE